MPVEVSELGVAGFALATLGMVARELLSILKDRQARQHESKILEEVARFGRILEGHAASDEIYFDRMERRLGAIETMGSQTLHLHENENSLFATVKLEGDVEQLRLKLESMPMEIQRIVNDAVQRLP